MILQGTMNGGLAEALLKSLSDTDKEPEVDNYTATRLMQEYLLEESKPYKVGEYITPKEGRNIKGHGDPCLVVQVWDEYQYAVRGEPGDELERYNMMIVRMVLIRGKRVVSVLADSDDFEPYTGLVWGDGGEKEEV
ncbi:MAG: hypothetical protein FWH12_02205 [Treponema sp.]|nr:hypothetical protein [Treponema sp.]